MIRALLDGAKSQTRRMLGIPRWADHNGVIEVDEHGVPHIICTKTGCLAPIPCPYGRHGDLLIVRESHRLLACQCDTCAVPGYVFYEADQSGYDGASMQRLRPSIHMPRWASRLTLRITDVRVERLQNISREDAEAEGLHRIEIGSGYPPHWSAKPATWADAVERQAATYVDARLAYRDLWESINGPGSWAANRWVWAISFPVIHANVDEVLKS